MKKAFVSLVVFLTFLMLITSVSAQGVQYYAVHFHADVNGYCMVYEGGEPERLGRGIAHIRGTAIAIELDTDIYGAYKGVDPNTYIWTRGASMSVLWNRKKLMVRIWADDGSDGSFWDTDDRISMNNLRFSGYYLEDSATPPQYIEGTVYLGFLEPSPAIGLYIEWIPFIFFLWPDARAAGVSVWPI